MQKISCYFSPTYTEKRKVNYYIEKIRAFRKKHLESIRTNIETYFEECKISRIGWSSEYYEAEHTRVIQFLDKVINLIEESKNVHSGFDKKKLNVFTKSVVIDIEMKPLSVDTTTDEKSDIRRNIKIQKELKHKEQCKYFSELCDIFVYEYGSIGKFGELILSSKECEKLEEIEHTE